MPSTTTEHRFLASRSSGEVSALLTLPEAPKALYVFVTAQGPG